MGRGDIAVTVERARACRLSEVMQVLGKRKEWIDVAIETLKFIIPSNDNIPALLKKSSDCAKIQQLLCPMVSSSLYDPNKAPNAGRKRPREESTQKNKDNCVAPALCL